MKLIAGSEYLLLEIIYIEGDREPYKDWVQVLLKIKLDSVEGFKEISLHRDEISSFIIELNKIKENKIRKMFFSNMEDDIALSIFTDFKGEVFVEGTLSIKNNKLFFNLITDLSAFDRFVDEANFEFKRCVI